MSNLLLVLCVILSICSSCYISSISTRRTEENRNIKLFWRETYIKLLVSGHANSLSNCLQTGKWLENAKLYQWTENKQAVLVEKWVNGWLQMLFPLSPLVFGLRTNHSLKDLMSDPVKPGYTLPWWLLLWYKDKFGGETRLRPCVQMSDACWAPVSCQEILQNGTWVPLFTNLYPARLVFKCKIDVW